MVQRMALYSYTSNNSGTYVMARDPVPHHGSWSGIPLAHIECNPVRATSGTADSVNDFVVPTAQCRRRRVVGAIPARLIPIDVVADPNPWELTSNFPQTKSANGPTRMLTETRCQFD